MPTGKSIGVIELRGHVELHLTHEGWSGTLRVTWEAPISFTSDVEKGLVVATRNKLIVNQPTSEGSDFAIGEVTLDKLSKEIQKDLESAIDISSIVSNLRQSLGGVYNGLTLPKSALVLSNPVFNSNGDLLAHLRVKGGEGVKQSVKPIITTGPREPSENTPTSAIRSLFGKGNVSLASTSAILRFPYKYQVLPKRPSHHLLHKTIYRGMDDLEWNQSGALFGDLSGHWTTVLVGEDNIGYRDLIL